MGLAGAFSVGAVGVLLGMDQTELLLVTTVGMAVLQVAGVWLVLRRRSHNFEAMGLVVRGSDGGYLGLGLVLQIALATLAYPFLELVGQEDGTTQVVVDQVAGATSTFLRAAVFLLVGFVGPAVEELVFRGVLLQMAEERFRPNLANLLTATIFSLVHVIGLAPGNVWASVVTLILLLLVGLVLGALTQRTGRLGPAIFTHAGYNLATLFLLYAAPSLLGS